MTFHLNTGTPSGMNPTVTECPDKLVLVGNEDDLMKAVIRILNRITASHRQLHRSESPALFVSLFGTITPEN